MKRAKDHVNHMWVAEATENSTYYLKYDHHYCSHLKDAFARVKKWEQSASLVCMFYILYLCSIFSMLSVLKALAYFLQTIEKLREKVLHIVGGPKG